MITKNASKKVTAISDFDQKEVVRVNESRLIPLPPKSVDGDASLFGKCCSLYQYCQYVFHNLLDEIRKECNLLVTRHILA